MDGKKWLDRWIGPVRETLEKLSRPQRLSLGLLGASLLVALGMLILNGAPTEDVVLYPTASAEEQITFTSWLDTQRIPYEPRSNGVRIPRSEIEFVNLEARMLKEEGKDQDFFMWVDKAASFQESHRARADRWSVSLKRSLENALARSEGIQSASVNFTPSPRRNSLMNRDLGAQASVQLNLDPGIKKFPGRRARAAGSFVAGALGLNLKNVSVTDNELNQYDLSATSVLTGGDDDHEGRYTAKITDFLEQYFSIDSFSVLVFVRQSMRSSEELETSVDPDNTVTLTEREEKEKAKNHLGSQAPGVKPNIAKLGEGDIQTASTSDEYERSNRENVVDYGKKEVRTAVPAGEIEEISISLNLDMQSVVDAIRLEQEILGDSDASESESVDKLKGEELKAEIERFRKKWEESLVSLTSIDSKRVRANVNIGPRPSLDSTAFLDGQKTGALAWAGENVISLILLGLTLFGGFFLLRAARTGIPQVADFPDPVAEIEEFLKKREDRIAEEIAVRAEDSLAERPAIDPWQGSETDQGTMELLEEVTRFAQENTDIAALVVRQWIKSDRTKRSSH